MIGKPFQSPLLKSDHTTLSADQAALSPPPKKRRLNSCDLDVDKSAVQRSTPKTLTQASLPRKSLLTVENPASNDREPNHDIDGLQIFCSVLWSVFTSNLIVFLKVDFDFLFLGGNSLRRNIKHGTVMVSCQSQEATLG